MGVALNLSILVGVALIGVLVLQEYKIQKVAAALDQSTQSLSQREAEGDEAAAAQLRGAHQGKYSALPISSGRQGFDGIGKDVVAAEAVPAGFVPVKVTWTGNDPVVTLCKLKWGLYHEDPSKVAMFRQLVAESDCQGRHGSKGNTREVRMSQLRLRLAQAAPGPILPTGFVFHESRVGSTLAANMLGTPANHVMYSESTPPVDVLLHCRRNGASCDDETRADYLRTVMLAMGLVGPKFDSVFFKFQSISTLENKALRAVFPKTPWIFIHREPVETMMSHMVQATPPCLRQRNAPHAGLLRIAGASASDTSSMEKERFCAAHLANLCQHVIDADAEDEVARGALRIVDYASLPAAMPDIMRQHFGVALDARAEEGVMRTATLYAKDKTGTRGTFEPDSEKKRKAASAEVKRWAVKYMAPRFNDLNRLAETPVDASRSAKVRRGGARLTRSETEKQAALASLEENALAVEAETRARARHPIVTRGSKAEAALSTRGGAKTAGPRGGVFRDQRLETGKIPDDPDYPRHVNLLDMLKKWPLDDTDVPADGVVEGDTLRRFDATSEADMEKALYYRNHEVPFVVTNTPSIVAAREKWTWKYLASKFRGMSTRAEKSPTAHFMYWNTKPGKKFQEQQAFAREKNPDYRPPTEFVAMTFDEWLEKALEMDDGGNGLNTWNKTHYYFHANGGSNFQKNQWILEDLPIFEPVAGLWMAEPDKNKGINCRIGMRGIAAASHFDSGRNFIAMIRGEKRYILNGPGECKSLYLYSRDHPEARHTAVDWWAPDLKEFPLFKDAGAVQLVLREGEVLYMPTGWSHYPVSLGMSAQCNSRSGVAPEGGAELEECGFR